MTEKEKVSLNMQDSNSKDIDAIKNTVKKMHKTNKEDVPKNLDNLKKNKNIKEATLDNDFLKYMLS